MSDKIPDDPYILMNGFYVFAKIIGETGKEIRQMKDAINVKVPVNIIKLYSRVIPAVFFLSFY